MNVEILARKLQPLMPNEVKAWMRTRDLDAGMRELVEQQITSMAYRVFGDFRSRILLSLPPRSKSRGTLRLGTVLYEREKWSFSLSESELLQNLAVFGRSGAGKTNAVFHLLQQLHGRHVPVLFLDWKRTGRHLLPLLKGDVGVFTPGRPLAPFAFDPLLVPPGVESSVYVNHLVDVIADSFTLGDGAKSLLHKTFNAAYTKGQGQASLDDATRELEQIPDKERVRAWKTSAIRALESLPRAAGSTSEPQQRFTQQLLGRTTILELDALSQGGRKFLVPLLCYWLYQVKLASSPREKLSLVIVVEEAHHVLYRQENRAKESLMNMLLRQCRELGIAFIIVDQHPHLISSAALGNTFTTFCLNLKDPSDINRAAGLCLLDENERRYLTLLPVGQGIIKLQDRWRLPFLLRFPLVPIQKGAVSDSDLQRFASMTTGSGSLRLLSRDFGGVQRVQADDDPLDRVELDFLEDVLTHKDDGVKERYRRLSVSIGRGHAVKEKLVAENWLDEAVVPVEQTRKVVLRLSVKAREFLGLHTPTRESLPHEYWKCFYRRVLEKRGYTVKIEAPRRIGSVDLLAESGRKRCGIEVETGSSNAVKNVSLNLREGFHRVLVVATDERAFAKVEKQLARAGLLMPTRVRVILAKNWKEVSWLDA